MGIFKFFKSIGTFIRTIKYVIDVFENDRQLTRLQLEEINGLCREIQELLEEQSLSSNVSFETEEDPTDFDRFEKWED